MHADNVINDCAYGSIGFIILYILYKSFLCVCFFVVVVFSYFFFVVVFFVFYIYIYMLHLGPHGRIVLY